MLNLIHSLIHRPERGWDPVPVTHAGEYSEAEWDRDTQDALIDELELWTGNLSGLSVLDLGGGPGQYSVAFAKRGAQVTWFDISENYRRIAEQRADEANVNVRFHVGYLDEAARSLSARFDLVFNRICWNYCRGDRSFARVVFTLAKPGGVVYVDTTHSGWRRDELSILARIRTKLNDLTYLKIGHPFPPRGRLARLFAGKPFSRLVVDYRSPHNDRITLVRKT